MSEIASADPYFRTTPRGIGYSFQLAITAPRMALIGYGIATAQSYLGQVSWLDILFSNYREMVSS